MPVRERSARPFIAGPEENQEGHRHDVGGAVVMSDLGEAVSSAVVGAIIGAFVLGSSIGIGLWELAGFIIRHTSIHWITP